MSVRAYLALTVGVLMRVGLNFIGYVWLLEVVSKLSVYGTEKVSADLIVGGIRSGSSCLLSSDRWSIDARRIKIYWLCMVARSGQ